MKTTTVMSSQLGDDWTPAAHMPRVITEAQFVRPGDRIRVRDHSTTTEGDRRWHPGTVEDVETHTGPTMAIKMDTWPICYVCTVSELVELVEITRTVTFRCMACRTTNSPGTHRVTVTLEDFLEPALLAKGELHVVMIDPRPTEVTGYCKSHGADLLS